MSELQTLIPTEHFEREKTLKIIGFVEKAAQFMTGYVSRFLNKTVICRPLSLLKWGSGFEAFDQAPRHQIPPIHQHKENQLEGEGDHHRG